MPEIEKIGIIMEPGETEGEAAARGVLSPTTQAASTIFHYMHTDIGIASNFKPSELISSLENKISKTLETDRLECSQRMLVAQAHSLDEIFNTMARMAAMSIKENINHGEKLLKIALRAQSQCRTTLEALNEIKNPKLANIVRQANISSGHQQVNNCPDSSRVEEIKNQPNELLEEEQHERLDFGAKTATVGSDMPMEAVGAVNGAKK